jgi:hypothetical protein
VTSVHDYKLIEHRNKAIYHLFKAHTIIKPLPTPDRCTTATTTARTTL